MSTAEAIDEKGLQEGQEDEATEGSEEKSGDQKADSTAKADDTTQDETKETEVSDEEDVSEVSRLRSLAREQKRELDRTRVELERIQRHIKKAGIVDEEDEKADKEASERAKALYAQRVSQLDTLLETMRLSPKYEDVDVVVSQDNFDDLVDVMAQVYVKEQGGSMGDAKKAIEAHIWSLPNPYRFAYEKIKQFHPSFKKSGDTDTAKTKTKAKDDNPPKVPTSVSGIKGGSSGGSGWTSNQIDQMDEEELDKVPRDVYEKYLAGELK